MTYGHVRATASAFGKYSATFYHSIETVSSSLLAHNCIFPERCNQNTVIKIGQIVMSASCKCSLQEQALQLTAYVVSCGHLRPLPIPPHLVADCMPMGACNYLNTLIYKGNSACLYSHCTKLTFGVWCSLALQTTG